MHLFSKPHNRWGWVRAAGIAALGLMLLWTALAALLTWWSGYKVYSLLDRVELAVLPLLVIFAAAWLEEHDHRVATEQSSRQEAERVVAERRMAILHGAREALEGDAPAHADAVVRAALPDLDGKGRGELLRLLYERGLLRADAAAVDWRGLDLGGLELHHARFNGIWLEQAALSKARLDGAHLHQARLRGASLVKAFLRRADLREASLAGCDLTRARLEHANLEGADLREARLEGAFLNHASLKGCSGVTAEMLDAAILVETILPDGRKHTNEHGKEYLRKKEIEVLVDRL